MLLITRFKYIDMTGLEFIKEKLKNDSNFRSRWGYNIILHIYNEEAIHAANKALDNKQICIDEELKKVSSIYIIDEPFASKFSEDKEYFNGLAKRCYNENRYIENTHAWSIDLFDTFYDGTPTSKGFRRVRTIKTQ